MGGGVERESDRGQRGKRGLGVVVAAVDPYIVRHGSPTCVRKFIDRFSESLID